MSKGAYGWKLATDPDDAANFLSGSGGYQHPAKDPQVTAVWTGGQTWFHIFYQSPDPAQQPECWGWKLATDAEDAMHFLNGTGAYCEPVKDARVAACWRNNRPEFYIFYTYALVPARIIDCRVLEATGAPLGFAHLCLGWTYCVGVRPERLAISVARSEGSHWTNIMPDGQPYKVGRPASAVEAEAIVLRLVHGPHKITFHATYADHEDLEYTFDRMI